MEVGDNGDNRVDAADPGDEVAEGVCGAGEAEGAAIGIVDHYFAGAVVFEEIAPCE